MFKSKVTISVMLAAVVGGCIFLCVCECLSGGEDWTAWAFIIAFGIETLILIWLKRKKKKYWV